MFEISIQHEFCAAHALSIAGTREPVHGHNWRVTATLAGATVDADGLLCDFHTVEAVIRSIAEQFDNKNLNDIEPFVTINPTAENVARHIGEELVSRLGDALAPHAHIASVTVTEAPGCAATYRLPQP